MHLYDKDDGDWTKLITMTLKGSHFVDQNGKAVFLHIQLHVISAWILIDHSESATYNSYYGVFVFAMHHFHAFLFWHHFSHRLASKRVPSSECIIPIIVQITMGILQLELMAVFDSIYGIGKGTKAWMCEEPVSFYYTFLIPEKHKTFSAPSHVLRIL
ncbi:hypothetical protein VNO77_02852 [Canavalia gladiata]|uniref:Uncharacterized protein n=1 Tax=Canavalia gladiata TaxID=3824 RepID=A0AAN9MUD5_CANGL